MCKNCSVMDEKTSCILCVSLLYTVHIIMVQQTGVLLERRCFLKGNGGSAEFFTQYAKL